jgi:hypothetical protein
MTYNEAVRAACKKAKKYQMEIYVVHEGEEFDTCDDDDLETFYLGAHVVGVAFPDGDYELA